MTVLLRSRALVTLSHGHVGSYLAFGAPARPLPKVRQAIVAAYSNGRATLGMGVVRNHLATTLDPMQAQETLLRASFSHRSGASPPPGATLPQRMRRSLLCSRTGVEEEEGPKMISPFPLGAMEAASWETPLPAARLGGGERME